MKKSVLRAVGPYLLRSVTFSHGWADLSPFAVEKEDGTINVTLRSDRGIRSVRVGPAENGIQVESPPAISNEEVQALRWMFRLDDDLNSFYQHAQVKDRGWILEQRLGRLLRSQTVFEDLIKLILTTNCSWSFTRIMVERLVKELGVKSADGGATFPDPKAFASKTEAFYRTKIRAGYRSPHLRTIGRAVAAGKLDPESWRDARIPTDQLRKEILTVPGAGPYVAENLLRFLGRSDHLGLDSWARGKLKELWGLRKVPSDRRIASRYREHGPHRGLVLWCDLTRDWFEGEKFSDWIRTSVDHP